jgi:hypothetical protein
MRRIIKSRRMRLAGHVTRFWEMKNSCKISVGKLEEKKPLERPGRK